MKPEPRKTVKWPQTEAPQPGPSKSPGRRRKLKPDVTRPPSTSIGTAADL